MEPVVFSKLLIALIGGVVSAVLASRKNRSIVGWGLAGALSFAIALIVLAFMPFKCGKCGVGITNDQWRRGECPACEALDAKAGGSANDSNRSKPSHLGFDLVEPVKQAMISSSDEELIYEHAAHELASASYKKGLWAKSIVNRPGFRGGRLV